MTPDPSAATLGQVLTARWALVAGFVAVHLWVIAASVVWEPQIYGDVDLYAWWARAGFAGGGWPVLDYAWIYPAGALLPVGLPAALTTTAIGYRAAWALLVIALNGLACWQLSAAGPRGRAAAWWWLAFLLVLGPIWLGRLDGVIAPLMVLAILEARRRPALAVAIATCGAWIKIAPGALVILLAACCRRGRELLRAVVTPGAIVSAIVLGLALLGGAGTRAFSVFGEQTGRGLQAESVAATFFFVPRLFDPSIRIEFNQEIFTFEVLGPAADRVASLLDLLLLVAVAAIGLLTWLAARRRPTATGEVLLWASLAMAAALIVFNKVGSPQFIAWIGAAIAPALALTTGRWAAADTSADPATSVTSAAPAAAPAAGRRAETAEAWKWVGGLGLVTAGLTQLIYPMFYGQFLGGEPLMVAVAALRNALVVALLVIAVRQLVLAARGYPRETATFRQLVPPGSENVS
ncbi:MAG: glycosyltransferase 87 family protein [Promicromonosporaceae bacterium]|nr:glycosyltransferase 87 family protein [Promicromonosporaceae bacterium]